MEIGYESFKVPELLFSRAERGIDKLVYDSIQACPIEARSDMFKNIVLAGQCSLFRGLPERLEQELQALAPDAKIKIIMQ